MSYMGHLGSIPDLNTLGDISVISPAQDQVLAFNALTSRWENKDIAAITVSMDELSDVALNQPSNGQVLMYDGVKWSNNFATKADRPFQFFLSSFN